MSYTAAHVLNVAAASSVYASVAEDVRTGMIAFEGPEIRWARTQLLDALDAADAQVGSPDLRVDFATLLSLIESRYATARQAGVDAKAGR